MVCTWIYLLRWRTAKTERVRNLAASVGETACSHMEQMNARDEYGSESSVSVKFRWCVQRRYIHTVRVRVRAPAPPTNCFVKRVSVTGGSACHGQYNKNEYTYANSTLQFCHQAPRCRETKLQTVHLRSYLIPHNSTAGFMHPCLPLSSHQANLWRKCLFLKETSVMPETLFHTRSV